MRATCPPPPHIPSNLPAFSPVLARPPPEASRASDLQLEGHGSASERSTRTLGRGDSRRTSLRTRMKETRMRLIVAMTGATGAVYGIHILKALQQLGVERHVILAGPR
jgi:hypothetical protein